MGVFASILTCMEWPSVRRADRLGPVSVHGVQGTCVTVTGGVHVGDGRSRYLPPSLLCACQGQK